MDMQPSLKRWRSSEPSGPDPLAPTVFHQPWWLDTVTGGQIAFAESRHEGVVVGRLPYLCDSGRFFKTGIMPPVTHILGPAITPGTGSTSAQALRQHAITRDLVSRLPELSRFRQKMHRGLHDVLAFQMAGFEVSVEFTYELQPLPAPAIWRGMRDKTRNAARQGERQYTIDEHFEPGAFVDLYTRNLASHGKSDLIGMEIVKRLARECLARGCGQILAARDQDKIPKAAIFCVWDRTACYYLMSTRSSDSGNGATTLLLWTAIQRAAAAGLVFDFDGVPDSGAMLFYLGFGANTRPRYIVDRMTLPYRLLRDIERGVLRKWDGKVFP